MILRVILEGLVLGLLLVLFCAVGIRNGAVNMVFLYHPDVQERCIGNGLITREQIRRNERIFKLCGIPVYCVYVLVCTYVLNGARGFLPGFLQILTILEIANLIDRLFIDEYWVGHTGAWDIPGTEDMKPYINAHDKMIKWLTGTIGFAVLAAILALIMMLFCR